MSLLAGESPTVILCYPGGARGQVAVNAEDMPETVGFQVTTLATAASGYFEFHRHPADRRTATWRSSTSRRPFSTPSPDTMRSLFYGGTNLSFYIDPGYNARFDAAAALNDDSARLAEYRQLDFDLSEAAVAIPIGYNTRLDAFAPRIGCRVYSPPLFGYAVNRLLASVSRRVSRRYCLDGRGRDVAAAPTSVTVPFGGEGCHDHAAAAGSGVRLSTPPRPELEISPPA